MGFQIRALGQVDAAGLDAFLAQHPSGITVRANARIFGVVDGEGPSRGLYLGALQDDELVGVVAQYDNGVHLIAPAYLDSLLLLLAQRARRPVSALFGMTPQVARARVWLDAADSGSVLDSRDELFSLELSKLRVPAALTREGVRCALATAEHAALLSRWRHDFMVENIGVLPGAYLLEMSQTQIENELAAKKLYVLFDGAEPVSTACFEPDLQEIVQVAYVYTPAGLRGRGYGAAVTAGALVAGRARGVRSAVLFTGLTNAPAQRAYRSIGFEPRGGYTMLVFDKPRLAAPGG